MGTSTYERMTLEELKAEYERISKLNFYLQMKDRWNAADRELDRVYQIKLSKLTKLIKDKGGDANE